MTFLEPLGFRSRMPSFRNMVLTLGFVVVVAGGVADIAHYLKGETAVELAPLPGASSESTAGGGITLSPDVSPAPGRSDTIGDLPARTELSDVNTYVVVAGDVLYEIAVRHGTSPQVLMDLNDLTDPNRIEVGQVLRLPESPATVSEIPDANADGGD